LLEDSRTRTPQRGYQESYSYIVNAEHLEREINASLRSVSPIYYV
jgi:hypothetical protein